MFFHLQKLVLPVMQWTTAGQQEGSSMATGTTAGPCTSTWSGGIMESSGLLSLLMLLTLPITSLRESTKLQLVTVSQCLLVCVYIRTYVVFV